MTLTIAIAVLILIVIFVMSKKKTYQPSPKEVEVLSEIVPPPTPSLEPTASIQITDTFIVPTLIFKLPNGNLLYLGVGLNTSHPSCSDLLKKIGTNQLHNHLIDVIKNIPQFDPNNEQHCKDFSDQTKKTINNNLAEQFNTPTTSHNPIIDVILHECYSS